MPNYKYGLIHHFKFEEEIPRATCWNSVEAIEITKSPEGKEGFVISESSWGFACPTTYFCHYYKSEAEMRDAFSSGLGKELTKRKLQELNVNLRQEKSVGISTILEILKERVHSNFKDFPGYIGSIQNDDKDQKPWFLAETGEEIEGDWVVQRCNPDPII